MILRPNAHFDPNKSVHVYKNRTQKMWSVRQGGKVIATADRLILKDCSFHVSEKGRQAVIKEGKRYVHAYVKGYITTEPCDCVVPIEYNPFTGPDFMAQVGIEDSLFPIDGWVAVDGAEMCEFTKHQKVYGTKLSC